MKILYCSAMIAELLSSLISFHNGDIGQGFGLLGGSGAFFLLFVNEF